MVEITDMLCHLLLLGRQEALLFCPGVVAQQA